VAKTPKSDVECTGFTKVNGQGQMLIPIDARNALGWDTNTKLIVFAEPSKQQLLVTVKPLDTELLDLATRGSVDAARKAASAR
jgi:bifunctional DNA-binding transcriptional regulator/antitoxin component of YhaV-PrlF toxin-antitoxin module